MSEEMDKQIKKYHKGDKILADNKDKKKYLEFVMLKDEEYLKPVQLYGAHILGLIENLNNYLGQTGKRYKSHYHTLLSFAKRDNIPVIKPKEPVKPVAPQEPIEVATLEQRAEIRERFLNAGKMFGKVPPKDSSQNNKQIKINAFERAIK